MQDHNQDSNNESIFHIAAQSDVTDAHQAGFYVCDSLTTEGFIHCCLEAQLSGVMDRYYQGVTDLVLLGIDPTLLQAALRYENTVGGTEEFPHIYGPINLDAVISQDSLS